MDSSPESFKRNSFLKFYKKQTTKLLLFIYFFFQGRTRGIEAYVDSQARGCIRATAAGLHHSHGNARSKPYL